MPNDKQTVPVAQNNLHSMDIVEIALAGVPAVPQATFGVLKAMDPGTEATPVFKTMVFKTDKVKKQAFGYMMVPGMPDWQGDVAAAEEIEKACHSLLKNAFQGTAKGTGASASHVDFEGIGYPIENCIDVDGSIGKAHGMDGIAGAWWLGMQCSDDAWDRIEKGEFTGFSIGGTGARTPIEGTVTTEKSSLRDILTKVTTAVSDALSKADGGAMNFDQMEMVDMLWDELYTKLDLLHSSILSIAYDDTVQDKAAAIGASIDQFRASLLSLLVVAKAGKEISAANQAVLQEVADATQKLQALLARINMTDEETIDKSLTQGGVTMSAEKVQELLDGVAALTKKIEDDVLPQLTVLEEFKKSQEKAAAAGANGSTDDDKKDPMEALGKSVDALTTTVADITERLGKIEKIPGDVKGGQKDDHDRDDFKPTGTPEDVAKAKMGHTIIHG